MKQRGQYGKNYKLDSLWNRFTYGYYEAPYPTLDMNDFKYYGVYRFCSHGVSIKNSPTTSQGCLIVYNAYYVYQIYYSEVNRYTRYYNADSKYWSAWKHQYF